MAQDSITMSFQRHSLSHVINIKEELSLLALRIIIPSFSQ